METSILSDDDDRGSKISSGSDNNYSEGDVANYEEHDGEDTNLRDKNKNTPQIDLKEGIIMNTRL
ncbi:hypothetical protein GcC1_161012 [Golovinomyces cichoracearum]|uniref:Uncharacterized protein n=1 Tax=Golovinomyces cichoracearum TaxID=62708 RepID=A0A420HU26_9PEZI|nr:hypothetical protein GcC1_161012 [Golovinomyces cichoracearum]